MKLGVFSAGLLSVFCIVIPLVNSWPSHDENDDYSGHVTDDSIPLVNGMHTVDPVEYVDYLLAEKYGLHLDNDNNDVTEKPDEEYDYAGSDIYVTFPERTKRDHMTSDDEVMLGTEPEGRDDLRLQTARSSRGDHKRITSPAIYYHPSTVDEDEEIQKKSKNEEDEVEEDNGTLDEPSKLKNLVKRLQNQVKASQTNQIRTRSVLTVIQEKQDKQAEDLSILKNEITKVRREVQENHKVMTALKALVGDNAWAVNNLKNEQKELRYDFNSMKQIQEEQNATQLSLLEGDARAEEERSGQEEVIQGLRRELLQVKKTVKEDRKNVNKMAAEFKIKLNRLRAPGRKDRSDNRINATPRDEDGNYVTDIPTTAAPFETTDEDGEYLEELLNSIEDQKEEVQEVLARASKSEHKMQKHVGEFSKRMVQYEAEISKIYTMIFNLSLQQSKMENDVLRQQQARSDHEIRDLQQSFINFTHHVLNLEQLHANGGVFANASTQNQREIASLTVISDDHSSRLSSLEQFVETFNIIAQTNWTALHNDINEVNNSMHNFQSAFSSHHSRAKSIFEEVSDKFDEFKALISKNDDRLAHVEVFVLNASLIQCHKNNQDILQDMKLSEFDTGVTRLDETVLEHGNQITRMDRGLSHIYQQIDRQSTLLRKVVDQVETLTGIVPEVTVLGTEVKNLIQDLPTDCADIQTRLADPADGVYLICPSRSVQSTRTYCEFIPGKENHTKSSWTVIQRRLDGTISFARTWAEYKAGFGDADGEFWLGNDNLNYLTSQRDYELRIDMWDLEGRFLWANYDTFRVDTEGVSYRLHVSGYTGNATDALRYSNYMPFSTMDKDNDVSSTHCAKFYTAGWWYKHCHYCNLNGRYTVGVVWFDHDTDEWIQLQRSEMKVKPKIRALNNQTEL